MHFFLLNPHQLKLHGVTGVLKLGPFFFFFLQYRSQVFCRFLFWYNIFNLTFLFKKSPPLDSDSAVAISGRSVVIFLARESQYIKIYYVCAIMLYEASSGGFIVRHFLKCRHNITLYRYLHLIKIFFQSLNHVLQNRVRQLKY